MCAGDGKETTVLWGWGNKREVYVIHNVLQSTSFDGTKKGTGTKKEPKRNEMREKDEKREERR